MYKFSDEKFEQYFVKTCDKRRTFNSFRLNKTILCKRNAATKGWVFVCGGVETEEKNPVILSL